MCQPSASNAIEFDINPTAISTTIIAAVTPITMRVRRSAWEKSGTKSCLLRKREWSVRCIRENYRHREKLSSKIVSDDAVEHRTLKESWSDTHSYLYLCISQQR